MYVLNTVLGKFVPVLWSISDMYGNANINPLQLL